MIPAGSVLSREHAVLVVVDVQQRLAAVMERKRQVLDRSALLVRAASIVGVPVLVTRQYPKGLGDIEQDLAAVLDEVVTKGATVSFVDKVSFDCFGEKAFCDAIADSGRSQLLLVGMETHICIAQTTLAALREGFDVHVAGDASCSQERECHDLALSRLAHAGAVITTSESAAYELVGRAGTDEFRALLAAVKG